MADLALWHFPISHFNEKARWALDWKNLPHTRRVLSFDYLPRALWATGRPTLPILLIDGKAISDSTAIIAALERLQPDPPLYPRDAAERTRALEIEDFLDENLGHEVRTVILGRAFVESPDLVVGAITLGMGDAARRAIRVGFRAFAPYYRMRHRINADTIAEAPRKVTAAMDRIVAETGPTGYLAGDRFSVADLTAAALLAPLVQPPEMQYRPAEPVLRAIVEAGRAFDGHRALDWTREMYRRHRGTSAETIPGTHST